MRRALLATTCLLSATSMAADMVWNIEDDTPQRYYVESVTVWPWATWLIAERNLEVRATQIELKMVTRCTPFEHRRRTHEVECIVEDAALIGVAMRPNEQDSLNTILEEYDGYLTGAKLTYLQRRDGRLLFFGLSGVPNQNRRTSAIREFLRGITRTAMSSLDFQIDPRLSEEGVWVQPTNRIMEFGNTWSMSALRESSDTLGQSATTSAKAIDNVGAVPVAHMVVKESAENVVVTSYGQGTWGQDFDMWMQGDLLFDTQRGSLQYRSWQVWGVERQKTGNQAPYANTGWFQRLEEGETKDVGGSGSWAEHATEDTAVGLMGEVITQHMARTNAAGGSKR